ncbi:MAG: hypothetical protein ACFB01_14970 [Cohaesibacteraceae bacterium]
MPAFVASVAGDALVSDVARFALGLADAAFVAVVGFFAAVARWVVVPALAFDARAVTGFEAFALRDVRAGALLVALAAVLFATGALAPAFDVVAVLSAGAAPLAVPLARDAPWPDAAFAPFGFAGAFVCLVSPVLALRDVVVDPAGLRPARRRAAAGLASVLVSSVGCAIAVHVSFAAGRATTVWIVDRRSIPPVGRSFPLLSA